MNNLPLFDVAYVPPKDPRAVREMERALAPNRDDVRRVITHKAGDFREVLEGKETGRTFRILELHSGQILCEFEDGTRLYVPGITSVWIADGFNFKTLVEVEP